MGANSTKGKAYNCPEMPTRRAVATKSIAAHYHAVGIPMTGLKRDGLSKAERTERNKLARIWKHLRKTWKNGGFTDKAAYETYSNLGGTSRREALRRG